MYDPKFEKRFWGMVDVKGPDDCWDWKGVLANGYGKLWNGMFAHRVAVELMYKEPIPRFTEDHSRKLFVCHICNNRSCVNPLHLYIGNASDNSHDRKLPGAGGPIMHRRFVRRKLSLEQIDGIRYFRSHGVSYRILGDLYKVSHETIRTVINKEGGYRF